MGKIIASCTHELDSLDNEGLGFTITIKDFDRENEPCLKTLTVCKNCLRMYKKMKVIIKDKK